MLFIWFPGWSGSVKENARVRDKKRSPNTIRFIFVKSRNVLEYLFGGKWFFIIFIFMYYKHTYLILTLADRNRLYISHITPINVHNIKFKLNIKKIYTTNHTIFFKLKHFKRIEHSYTPFPPLGTSLMWINKYKLVYIGLSPHK